MLEQLPGGWDKLVEGLRTMVIAPTVAGIRNGVKAAKKLALQEIETPDELSAKIEEKCKSLEEYIPHLPEELKDEPCGAMNLEDRTAINHLANQIDDKQMRMKVNANEYFILYVWQIMNLLEDYSTKEHPQSIRIDNIVLKFLREYHGTRRRDLPALLRGLCANINSTIVR